MLTLEICGVEEYVKGVVEKPDVEVDRPGFQNWEFNDRNTWGLIINNVMQGVKHRISTCKTAKEMWSSLAAIFESKAHLTLRAYKRSLWKLMKIPILSNISTNLKYIGNKSTLRQIKITTSAISTSSLQ